MVCMQIIAMWQGWHNRLKRIQKNLQREEEGITIHNLYINVIIRNSLYYIVFYYHKYWYIAVNCVLSGVPLQIISV